MRSVFMGTPHYPIPVLEVLLSLGGQVVGVYTPPDKPRGRGLVPEPSAVKSFALEHGLEVFQPSSLRRASAQSELASLGPDVIVVAAYGKLLPPEVLTIPPHGCVNVHPSLLPRYRGPSPVATAIVEGEDPTGTTIILMDEGMDTGPILSSRALQIDSSTATTETLTPLLFQMGAELLKEVLPLWLEGRAMPRPQDHSQATVTRRLERADGEARWEMSAEELERRLRAYAPWPGLFTYWKGRLLKILSATCISYPQQESVAAGDQRLSPGRLDTSGQRQPGMVVRLNESDVAVGVVTGCGVLGIKRLQIEGKRPTSSNEFLSGYQDFPGSVLPS